MERLRLLREKEQPESDHFLLLCLQVFNYQYRWNTLYRSFCDLLQRNPSNVKEIEDIPFLPIQFFKSHPVKTGEWQAEATFSSSGTTGQVRSKHHIKSLADYLENTKAGFSDFYGSPEDYCFISILPGYVERPDSSLIHMVHHFTSLSKYEDSGFYLGRESEMIRVLEKNKKEGIPSILFGVSFALLDLAATTLNYPELLIIETGGMKNSTVTLTKKEIINKLKEKWCLRSIHSEYGMTEMLSQSYSQDGVWFLPSRTKKVIIGELRDPLSPQKNGRTGVIKVADLANVDTCSFIETQDLGVANNDGTFQVLGRMDNAELRGCNLLLDDALEDPVR